MKPQCAACGAPFCPIGRRRHCSAACRQRAYRLRRTQAASVPEAALVRRPRSQTVYECPNCEARYLGEQRCPDCDLFCRRIGPGGLCPCCEEPVAICDLLDLAA